MTIDKKIEWMDLGSTGKQLDWEYHGHEDMYLEGRILGYEGRDLKIALCGPWKEDIKRTFYDSKRKEFQIYVMHPPFGEVRIALLTMVPFIVPEDVKKVLVYETLFVRKAKVVTAQPVKNCWDPRTWGGKNE